MTRVTRRWVVGLALVVLITMGLNTAVMFSSSAKLVARMWAQGLTPSDRAAASRQFYALPQDFRGALLKVMTGAEKSTMFRAQLASYMSLKTEDLTAEQRAVLQEAYDLVTPEFCSQRHDTDPINISVRLKAALPKEDASLFIAPGGDAVIGLQSKELSSVLPLTVQAKLFMSKQFAGAGAALAAQGWCDCDIPLGTDICLAPPDARCDMDHGCGIDGGCGFLHLYNCHGICLNGVIYTH